MADEKKNEDNEDDKDDKGENPSEKVVSTETEIATSSIVKVIKTKEKNGTRNFHMCMYIQLSGWPINNILFFHN